MSHARRMRDEEAGHLLSCQSTVPSSAFRLGQTCRYMASFGKRYLTKITTNTVAELFSRHQEGEPVT